MNVYPSPEHLEWSSKLLTRLEEIKEDIDRYKADEQEDEEGEIDETVFYSNLQLACDLVREADSGGAPNLPTIVERVDNLINEAVHFAYGDAEFDYLNSFAHEGNTANEGIPYITLVEDEEVGRAFFGNGLFDMFTEFLSSMMRDVPSFPQNNAAPMLDRPAPYDSSRKPHSSSTPLARFRNAVNLSANTSTPLANIIYQARCEIESDELSMPISCVLSPGGSCLAVPCSRGWKNREPYLKYYLLDEAGKGQTAFPSHSVDVALSGIAYASATDEDRKLIFVADDHRIKSYAWGNRQRNFEEAVPVHTLNSQDCQGPLIVLNGRILRAGDGFADVWNIDTLEKHIPGRNNVIGGTFDTSETMRDMDDFIEPSQGSEPHNDITFEDYSFEIGSWHPHPSLSSAMLCSTNAHTSLQYYCHALDMENGKTVGKYLGHGGNINNFSTSRADPNIFLTACSDGCARLYDVRHPMPVLTFNVTRQSGPCANATLAHPDGIPTVFTGAEKEEEIKMWDVRAQAPVYDLATGNNAVVSLAWDERRNSLYAATECSYMDRMGSHHDYRNARKVRRNENNEGAEAEMDDQDDDYEDEEEDDNDDDDDDENDGRMWPTRAYHAEDYYGYTFDAASHRMYRYAFKEDADAGITPHWGQAYVGYL
ncbi:hypothetical protein SERLA73DRAFT_73551 [Serpula lacrymans var. lacrymans S7.3]|uniref:Uncharacterized protein n=2 Tax=Serpula lacrymans var. lacrymans TaxID=341189 RepID=F8PYL2_SERL3|nr:uncharacterized protein SERLADRAFT_438172 [Serpula lacrymans var. lacrymans S7.9]EGN98975.1 hypothetical protein SERLA73DRAFT_73551 [Serpula lacrymans var. lacrymans S7.3]EGO24563.1 hypothetical protein SERLADRAFT_438172 [Serpula lacrymans var. lacrymans S7.9]